MGHKITMYENLRDMIDRELGEIERKRDIDQQSLDNLYKLTMSLKAINKAIDHTQMDEMDKRGISMGMGQSMAGHSFGAMDGRPIMQVPGGQIWNRMPYMRSNEQSYDASYGMSYDGGQSMARRGRDGDGDGRYNESRGNDMGQSQGRTYGHEYDASRDASKKKMAQKLETLMDDTMSEKERAAIQECIQKIRQQ